MIYCFIISETSEPFFTEVIKRLNTVTITSMKNKSMLTQKECYQGDQDGNGKDHSDLKVCPLRWRSRWRRWSWYPRVHIVRSRVELGLGNIVERDSNSVFICVKEHIEVVEEGKTKYHIIWWRRLDAYSTESRIQRIGIHHKRVWLDLEPVVIHPQPQTLILTQVAGGKVIVQAIIWIFVKLSSILTILALYQVVNHCLLKIPRQKDVLYGWTKDGVCASSKILDCGWSIIQVTCLIDFESVDPNNPFLCVL